MVPSIVPQDERTPSQNVNKVRPCGVWARAAERLSHGRVVSIPYGTHLTSAECTDNLIAEFVRTGSEKGLTWGVWDRSGLCRCDAGEEWAVTEGVERAGRIGARPGMM